MKWRPGRRSADIEDRRSAGGGFGGGLPIPIGRLGGGGIGTGRSTYDRGILEGGDLEEGIGAGGAVGDDRIQSQAQGRIDPESFTHGSSEQRGRWLRAGFDSGRLEACDTFSGRSSRAGPAGRLSGTPAVPPTQGASADE